MVFVVMEIFVIRTNQCACDSITDESLKEKLIKTKIYIEWKKFSIFVWQWKLRNQATDVYLTSVYLILTDFTSDWGLKLR